MLQFMARALLRLLLQKICLLSIQLLFQIPQHWTVASGAALVARGMSDMLVFRRRAEAKGIRLLGFGARWHEETC